MITLTLLYGPPGCGKTKCTIYIYGMGLPLVTMIRLDGMISSLLGEYSKNIRKIFDFASRQGVSYFQMNLMSLKNKR